jgi:small subunit ribosomal protein S16
MLTIRYQRVGKKNYAQFKIVVAEKSAPVKGKFVEALGSRDPHQKQVVLKEDRIKYWLDKGAQCSDSVFNLLVSQGVVSGPKRKINLKKKEVEEGSEAKAENKTEETPIHSDQGAEKEDKSEEKPVSTEVDENKPSSAKATEDKKEEK